jgi:hypothetical protein
MSTDFREEDLVRRARAALDRSVDTLDPATLGRLRAARRDALAGAASSRARRTLVWAPLGALAAAGLAIAIALSSGSTKEATTVASAPPAPPPRLIEDLEVVAESEDLELYADLEFYEWLDAGGSAG